MAAPPGWNQGILAARDNSPRRSDQQNLRTCPASLRSRPSKIAAKAGEDRRSRDQKATLTSRHLMSPQPGVQLLAMTRGAPSKSTELSYSFLPPGEHAELLVVRFYNVNDLINAFAQPTPPMMLQIPQHSQCPGEAIMILGVGKRKRTFACPNLPSAYPAGSPRGVKRTEVMTKFVVSRKVPEEHIDRVEEIIRSVEHDDEMTSVEWCLKVLAIADQEGCLVPEPHQRP